MCAGIELMLRLCCRLVAPSAWFGSWWRGCTKSGAQSCARCRDKPARRGRDRTYSAFRNAIDGMKKYSPPRIVTACGAALTVFVAAPFQATGHVVFGRVPCPMT